MKSEQYSLNQSDMYKTLRGAAIIALSVIITQVSEKYTDMTFAITLGDKVVDITQYAVVLIATILELGRRFVADNQTQ